MRESYSNLYIQIATPQFSIQALEFRMVQFLRIHALPVDYLTYTGSNQSIFSPIKALPCYNSHPQSTIKLQFSPTQGLLYNSCIYKV